MVWTPPVAPTSGTAITVTYATTNLVNNLKAIGDAWTTYAPTYTGLTIGNATVTSKYLQAGKLVIGEVKIVFGSTSTFSGSFTITLPVSAAVVGIPVGTAWLNDASAGTHRSALALVDTGSATRVLFVPADGTTATVTNTVPFTWTTSDILAFPFAYEAA